MKKTGVIKHVLTMMLCLLMISAALPALPLNAAAAPAKPEQKTETKKTEQETELKEPAALKKDLVILFTGDVHCGIDQNFGLAGLSQLQAYYEAQGKHTLLVDVGDFIQGEVIGTMTRGGALIDLMNRTGYDVAIPGNHEFDYGMERFLDLAQNAEFPYISCNFNKDGELLFDPYIIKEFDGVKFAFVGVTTPKTLTTSTPRYFQDSEGNFIYGFFQDDTGELLYSKVQEAVDAAREEGADYVIALTHLGDNESCAPFRYDQVIAATTGIDVVLDGHKHDTEQVVMKNKDGKDVIRSATGTKMEHIGIVTFGTDGTITNRLMSWKFPGNAQDLFGIRNEAGDAVTEWKSQLGEIMDEVVAKSGVELVISDPKIRGANGQPIRLVRRTETNLGDLCADAIRLAGAADIGLINGGGVRKGIPAGDITRRDILAVFPFGNAVCVAEMTGKQLLDALEWGAHVTPDEHGGVLQVSGLTYEIHTYI
ncbi:MAG: bifunctional metallophosphatase/5'-nucleotidase, partial [Lachnospiraceae bacterium]|nr:bifunctional metallophosphatase/5'-nucleotidase [Lachnospiraceae bacterium]